MTARHGFGGLLLASALAVAGAGCSGSSSGSESSRSRVTTAAGPDVTSRVSVSIEDIRSSLTSSVEEILSELDAAQREEGTVITLPELVLFDFNRADLKPEAAATLDKVVEVVQNYRTAPVSIRGHTDGVGSDDYNVDLSNRRARAVRVYLVDRGVEPGRLRATGLGKSQPVAPNTNPDGSDNPEGRQQNRRVEVIVEGVHR